MQGETFKVNSIPFKRQVGNPTKGYNIITFYVGYCGCCGNPIDRYTSRRFCRFCRNDIEWDSRIHPHKYKIDERAIELTIDKI